MDAPFDYADLIGAPFEYGARGPASYDCYGLVRECWWRMYGQVLPDFQSPTDEAVQHALTVSLRAGAQPLWVPVAPQAGAVVLMRVEGNACHTGFSLSEDQILHTWISAGGVLLQPVRHWRERIVGWYKYAR